MQIRDNILYRVTIWHPFRNTSRGSIGEYF